MNQRILKIIDIKLTISINKLILNIGTNYPITKQ
jgi:hypothetical protein